MQYAIESIFGKNTWFNSKLLEVSILSKNLVVIYLVYSIVSLFLPPFLYHQRLYFKTIVLPIANNPFLYYS